MLKVNILLMVELRLETVDGDDFAATSIIGDSTERSLPTPFDEGDEGTLGSGGYSVY